MGITLNKKFPFVHKEKTITMPVLTVEEDSAGYFYSITGSTTEQNTTTVDGQLEAYQRCPAVSGIVHRKVTAHNNANLYILNDEGKEAPNVATYATIRRLLSRPNVLQSWDQFYKQAQLFLQIFGEVYIFALIPTGFSKNNIKALWVLPNWYMTLKTTGQQFFQTEVASIIEGYYLGSSTGQAVKLPTENIIHIKDSGYNYTYPLQGYSRLAQLQDPVSNIIASLEARNVLITRRGAIGILSNESKDNIGAMPLKPEEKKSLQNDFRKYGLMRDKWQVIISNAALRWQSMTYPTRDLMLFEEIEDDTRQIADNYGYPMHLLGFTKGTTFSNVDEAKKSLYQDTIIPEADAFFDVFNDFFELKEKGYVITPDFSHLEVFQQSRQEAAAALLNANQAWQIAYQNGIVTLEEWRTAIDLDSSLPIRNDKWTIRDLPARYGTRQPPGI